MKRVAMFVTNPCTHDARVMKEAKSLSENGYEVRIFALSNANYAEGVVNQDNYTVHRLKFDNVFKRTQNTLWKALGAPKRGIKKLFSALSIGILSIIAAPLALAGGVLLPFFPSLGGSLLNKAKHLINKDTSNREKVAVKKKINKMLLINHFFRKHRVNLYIFLKRNFSFYNRKNLQKIIFKLGFIFLYLTKFVYKLFRTFFLLFKKVSRLILLIKKRVYTKLKRTRSLIIKKGNRIIYITLLPIHKLTTYYFFCKEAANLASVWQPDIAHAHDLNTLYAAKLVKKNTNSKIVYDSHELWIHRNRVNRKATIEKQLDRIVEKHLIKEADAIITVCDSIGEWLSNKYDSIPKPVILRNMPYLLSNEHSPHNLKDRYGINKNDIAIIYTGKITTGRGIDIGIKVLEETDNTHFLLLGYGNDDFVFDLEKQILEKKLQDRVTFCAAVPHNEVSSFIAGADIALVFIEPICLSYEYALPNKLFESIQAGIPIMGSNLIEIKKIVDENEVGLCFSNENDLIDKIKNLDEEKIKVWQKNILNKKNSLCWEYESKKLIQSYKKLQKT